VKQIRQFFKRAPLLHIGYHIFQALRDQYGVCINFLRIFHNLFIFFKEYHQYCHQPENNNFMVSSEYIRPYLTDKTKLTPIDPTYFLQDTWAAKKIFQNKPDHHYDIGSSASTIGIISQFIPVTMVDLRPIAVPLENLCFEKGDILHLPFADNSIKSLSSLCVVEHIGLGRYGDSLDQWGSEKAIVELTRVLAPGGNLYFSVPVDSKNRVWFNAHRSFTREYILDLFQGMELIEERYIYGGTMEYFYNKGKGFGTGLYHFSKTS
jgi:SAM-dependent methyltransferase